jgi:type IV pilus biogenesis protein CpaD/CtpE
MIRFVLGACAITLFMGCASTPPGIVLTAPARADAFECAKDYLLAQGYDLRTVDDAAQTLEAEVRQAYPPVGAVREIITTSVAQAEDAADAFRISVQAFGYRSAEHNLPIHRQSITEIRPSEHVLADGKQVLTSCGTRPLNPSAKP